MRQERRNTWIVTVVGAVVGVAYGLTAYALFDRAGDLMIWSFLLLVPFALGVTSGALTRREEGFGTVALRVLLSVMTFALTALLLAWEGLICLVFALPILYLAAFVGGGLGFLLRGRSTKVGAVMLALAVPYVAAPLERARSVDATYRTTQNSVVIQATPADVWRQIQSVPRIRDDEFTPSWSHAIGLPRPVAAVLDRAGVGGVRTATFADGLSFRETVTVWEPGRSLAFRIEARDPGRLDRHVRVGGETFDVVSGRYDIESLGNGLVLLHLTSTQRVHSHVGRYVGWAVNAIMSDLQQSILNVVRKRAQSEPGMTRSRAFIE
ncbi:SRPBCC family protein [Deinococcus yavapaiensis]|uniref:Polyketide cyclase/dehydrase/lipid transport protein n=1 Tax=Deinococcus yavapaiensis KR-236 TaxID=694435 RepID=A0A318SJP7_9DEIO|nr:SRPBCC family protein [Deinococcus yavapaiensis]PYE52788.1 polyketide cyclase/dehydrase/lipid transport protein [Deinococcus yavapaiensis KR-236]